VRFVDPTSGRPATVVARLEEFRAGAPGGGELVLTEAGADSPLVVRLEDVQLARLEIEL